MYILFADGYRKFEFNWINCAEQGQKASICIGDNNNLFYYLDSDLILRRIGKQITYNRQVHPYEISTLDRELYDNEGIVSFQMPYFYTRKWEYILTLTKQGDWYGKLAN
jgi:hypothetical protein